MKICLIGSSRFKDLYGEINRRLTLDGHICYSIATVSTSDGSELPEEQKMILDLVHLRKIAESEACVLVTDETGYFGFSTKREMIWAQILNIPIMDCRRPIQKAFQEVGWTPDIRKTTERKIEALFETAQAGEPRAYFELEKNGQLKRGIYIVYSFIGNDDQKCADKLVEVFEAIQARGGKHLYWRVPLEFSPYLNRRRVYARVCVLDKDWNDVTRLPGSRDNRMGRTTKDAETGERIEDA